MNAVEILLAFAALHLLLGGVLFLLALLLERVRALDAERRSWLLLATLVLAIALPAASFLPGWARPFPTWTAEAPAPLLLPDEGARVDEAVYEAGQRRDTIYLEIPRSFRTLLVLAWLLGSAWCWMRLADGWQQARRLRRSAHRDPALEAAMAHVLPHRARIATTLLDGPMVVGLHRPCIVIPRELATRLTREALEDVVRHEVAHIERGDLWWAAALRGAMSVFWWNPFLHAINARLELAREMACDARAARACAHRSDYADSLLCSAEALFALGERRDWLAVGMLERPSQLARRIDGLVGDEAETAGLRRRTATMVCVLALTTCTGLAIAAAPRITLPHDAVAEPDARVVALLAAARVGDRDAVRRLVQDGADVDARVLDDGTALIQAVRSRDLATVDTVLGLGADPNRASLGEGNPLIVASALGLQPIVERLVAAGADVNRIVTYDETPLINAARGGHLSTVRYLVAHGADVNLGVEADGWLGRWRTPLNQARDPAVRAFLVEQGAAAERR